MPEYQITNSKSIFDSWQTICSELKILGSGIVQNDIAVSAQTVSQWESDIVDKIAQIQDLMIQTKDYVTSVPLPDDPNMPGIWIVLAEAGSTAIIRVKLFEPLTKMEAEEMGKESCAVHGFTYHGVFTEDEIERAEMDLEIPF